MEEESGVPKNNIILAVVLAIAVYGVWYYLMPKPAPMEQTAASVNAPAVPASPAAPVPQSYEEVPVNTEHFTTSVRLDTGSPLLILSSHKIKGDVGQEILLSGSSFLATRVSGQQENWKLKNVSADGFILETGLWKKEIRFDSADGHGKILLTLSAKAPQAQAVEIEEKGNFPFSGERDLNNFAGYLGKESLIIEQPKSKQQEMTKELAPGKPLAAVGLASRYHIALLLDLHRASAFQAIHPAKSKEWVLRGVLNPGETVEIPFYAGLKTDQVMKDLGLEKLMFGGMLGPLKRLIRSALTHLYQWTGNYGVAIILLTLLIQIVLLPLTWKNVKLSLKMKELMPKVKAIQDKYKSDPTKMNQEMMDLYKKQGANPLGGCLLLLPQMPIFFALYTSINENYALFGAPFTLWIKNLAAHDPTYILPLVMGGAMLLQAKLNSSVSTDPSQKMMAYMMPAMFTFMFLKFPSGLVLYWLTSNVLSIGITAVMPKFMDKV